MMRLSNYEFSMGKKENTPVIWIRFPYDIHLINELKTQFPSARWSKTFHSWYIRDTPQHRNLLQLPEKKPYPTKDTTLSPDNQQALERFIQHLELKAYSTNTIKIYVQEFKSLLVLLKNVPVNSLTPERLKDYFLFVLKTHKLKEQSMNSKINAIKFYFEQVLHQPKMFFDIPRPKTPLQLPKLLSRKEIKKLFSVTENMKHRLMLQLCYGMGLRVSEIVHLKIEHIDSESKRVLIASSKGKKDRYVPLPESVLEDMRLYYKTYRPKEWLFEGIGGGMYSIRSVQAVFKNALRKAEIKKNIGIHGLRHSYATHLIESGADIRLLKDLLGHQSIKTTQVYTHVTEPMMGKIKSPLDEL